MAESSSTVLERLMHAAQRYIAYCAVLLLVIITLRFYEAFVICNVCHFPSNSLRAELYGLLCDGYVFLRICALGILPFCLLLFLKPIMAELIMIVYIFLLLFVTLALQLYFATSMVPLGADLLGYSFSQICHTIGTSCGFSMFLLLPFLFFGGYTFLMWKVLRKRDFPNFLFYIFYLVVAISLLLNDYSSPSTGRFKTEFESYLASNKLGFLISKMYHYFEHVEDERNQKKKQSFSELMTGSSEVSLPLSVNFFYKVNDNLDIKTIDKPEGTIELQMDLTFFLSIDDYSCSSNHILPDLLNG